MPDVIKFCRACKSYHLTKALCTGLTESEERLDSLLSKPYTYQDREPTGSEGGKLGRLRRYLIAKLEIPEDQLDAIQNGWRT